MTITLEEYRKLFAFSPEYSQKEIDEMYYETYPFQKARKDLQEDIEEFTNTISAIMSFLNEVAMEIKRWLLGFKKGAG